MYIDSQYGPTIDLSGPDGNAHVLMGHATNLSRQMGFPSKPIIKDMMSGDYDHLVYVFEQNFPSINLIGKPE